MLLAFGILIFTIVALAIGGVIAGVAPLLAIPIAFVLLVAGGAVIIVLDRRRPAVVRERESVEFTEEDYETLAHRPEHTHGDVKRGPTRPPGGTP